MWRPLIRLGKAAALLLLGSIGCATEIEAYEQVGIGAGVGPELRRSSLYAWASNAAVFRTPSGGASSHNARVAPVYAPVLQLVRSTAAVRRTKLSTSISAARAATSSSCARQAVAQATCRADRE